MIADALAGIRRSRPAPPDRKDPADAEIVLHLLRSIVGDNLAALRDRALIAFGMALAARRSELVGLDVAELAWEDKGVRVIIRRSKTDQEAAGVVVAVPDGRRLAPPPSPRLARGRRYHHGRDFPSALERRSGAWRPALRPCGRTGYSGPCRGRRA